MKCPLALHFSVCSFIKCSFIKCSLLVDSVKQHQLSLFVICYRWESLFVICCYRWDWLCDAVIFVLFAILTFVNSCAYLLCRSFHGNFVTMLDMMQQMY